ncbi:MAG: hypothetical protein R3257_02775, partial [bacterium]|nr:hypothetical protein [bacterium]
MGVNAAGSQPTDTPPPAGADAPNQPPPSGSTGLPQSGTQGAAEATGDQLLQQFMNGQIEGTEELVKQMQDQTLQQNILSSTRAQTGATMQQAQRQSYHSDADQRTTTNEQRATQDSDATRQEGTRQDSFQDRGRTRSRDTRSGDRNANLRSDISQAGDNAARQGTQKNVSARRQALVNNLAKQSGNNPGQLRNMAEAQIGRQSDQAFLRLPQSKQTPAARQFIKAQLTMNRLQQLRQEVRQARQDGQEVPEGLENALDQAIQDAAENMPEMPAELAGTEFDVQEEDSTDDSTEAGDEADDAAEESGLRADQTIEGTEGEGDGDAQGQGEGQPGTEGGQGIPANYSPTTVVNYQALRHDANFGLLSTAGAEHAETEGNLSTDSRILGSIVDGNTRVSLQQRGSQVRIARVGARTGRPRGDREDGANISLDEHSILPGNHYSVATESGSSATISEWQLVRDFETEAGANPQAEFLEIRG